MTHAKVSPLAQGDMEDDRIATAAVVHFMRISIRVLLGGSLLALLIQRIVIPDQTIRSLGPALVVFVAVIAWVLLARDKARAATYVLILGLWAAVSTVITITNGVLSPMVSSYAAIIIATGWLLSPRAAVVVTGITVAGLFGLAIGELTGFLSMLPDVPRLLGAGVSGIVFIISALMVIAGMRVNQNRLAELRRVGRELAQRTQDLEAAIVQMKDLVHARDESENRFRGLMENIEGVAVQGYAMDGTVTYWNTAAQHLYGYSAAEALGGNLLELIIPDEMRDGVTQAMQQMAATGVSIPASELLLKSKSGASVPVFSSHALVHPAGRPAELFCMDIDLSVHKQYEAELIAAKSDAEQANKAKSTFLTAVTHDLGQPLSALSLLVSVLKQSAPPTTNRLTQNMQDCVDGMSGLLTDLMDVSKLDAGVVIPTPSDFAVDALLASVVSVQSVEALMKGLRMRSRRSAAFAHTDFKLVQRILGNLVSNAVRHTSSGGVLLACRVRAGQQWVEVWDTGVGIAPDKTELVFEEFTQLKDDARTIGSGLGLAIVTKTARLLGLQVRLTSRVGRGSMFAIALPPGRACEVVGQVATPPRLRPSRIGLVDDNAMLLESLVFALEDAKYEVVAATNAKDLLERLGAQAPDIVISDYRLGAGETGIDVIDATRRVFGADLPCLIITADTGPALSVAMAKRSIAVLYKPLDVPVFLAFVKEATERRKAQNLLDR